MAFINVVEGVSGRLRDSTGFVGRLFDSTQGERLARDSVLAEAVWDARSLATTQRRAAVRDAIQAWVAAGGRLTDLRSMLRLVTDGNQTLIFGGDRIGYVHGEVFNTAPLFRFVTLAEELADAEGLATLALRNAALDAAVTKFVTAGGTT